MRALSLSCPVAAFTEMSSSAARSGEQALRQWRSGRDTCLRHGAIKINDLLGNRGNRSIRQWLAFIVDHCTG
jgi:hypothetical protein